MAYRRKIIDRRTREGKALGRQLDTLKGFGIIALIGGALLFGRGHSNAPVDDGKNTLVATAQASPTNAVAQQSNAYAPFDTPAQISATSAMNSIPPLVPPPATDTATRTSIPWRHVTASGTRWSLRRTTGTLLLMVDLGGDQVASVSVAPAFENLDLTSMNVRVDHLRSVISQQFSIRTATYSFERDGSIRLLP